MSERSRLPPMVTTRRSKSKAEIQEDEDSNSDFDEFGFDSRPSVVVEPATQEVDGSSKKNKTKLGKIMSKTAKTIGSGLTAVSMLSPKKHSDHSERDSYSAPSTPNTSTFSGFRSSQSMKSPAMTPAVKSPEVTLPRTRPESLPLNRSASKVPVRATSSHLPPRRPSVESADENDARKPSPDRLSVGENVDILSPTVVAHSFSMRLSEGINTARADTVVPVLQVQNLLQSSGHSSKHQSVQLSVEADVGDDGVHLFTELEFPTPPSHPVHPHNSFHSDGAPTSIHSKPTEAGKSTSTPSKTPVKAPVPDSFVRDALLSETDFGTVAETRTNTINTTTAVSPAAPFNYPAETSEEVFYSNNPPVTAHPIKVDAQPLAIVRYMRLLVKYSPEPLSSMFAKVEPVINKWAHTLHFIFLTVYILLEILLELAIEGYTALKPYRPELLFPSFAGLIMCFFGGSFVTTIAAAEAYRLVGYETTMQCVKSLMEDFKNVLEAAEKDAALGIDDVEPSQDNTVGTKSESFDIWSDLRQETEVIRDVETIDETALENNHSAAYHDGTESLCEQLEHHGTAAGLEGLVVPHPHVHTTPVKKAAPVVPASTPAGSRMSTRSTSRKGPVPAEPLAPRSTTASKLRKRRSMFDAHSDGLDAFRSTVLEQRTPAKSRASILSSQQSATSAAKPSVPAALVSSTAESASAVNCSGNNSSAVPQPIAAVAVPSPLRPAKRASIGVSQSLEEYQREQEELGADTTASKALFFLQNVDPQRFTNAIVGINAGLVAVVATLKVQFAKTITLGSALSKAIDGPAKAVLKPLVELALPKPYKKWADVLLTYSIKSFAISIAWTLRRVVSSFHSAIRGGLMFSKNLLSYLVDMGVLKEHHVNSAYIPYIDTILGYTVALLGLWFQLSYGFALPFPLNVILFPFTILEYMLVWMVNNSHYILGQY